MARVLRAGGLLLVMDFSLPEIAPLREVYRLYLHKVLPRFAAAITGNKEAYEYLGSSIESLSARRAKCESLWSAADFPISARDLSASESPASTRLERKPTNKHPRRYGARPNGEYGRRERAVCEGSAK